MYAETWFYLLALTFFVQVISLFQFAHPNPDARRLYDDIMKKKGYNKLIRPVQNNNDTLPVTLGLKLTQLTDIDEKNQVMTTNVWLLHAWQDYSLTWDPNEYGGVEQLYIPSEEIWLPDVVLYNNADGNYEVTIMTKAKVDYKGRVVWQPPAIYKSSCPINVEFFPFDEQHCNLKFGSWTYDGFQVDLLHEYQNASEAKKNFMTEIKIDKAINLAEYYPSVEWDLMAVPARRNAKKYPCCVAVFVDITFYIAMRRKTLFYTVNLIIPCVAISFLTVLVFYLPSDSGEKITLCISILLSLTVFFLLLAEIIPPTSLAVPLITRYLMFTTILVTLSIIVTVIVLNIHFRSAATHSMPVWVRTVFLKILPRILLMRRPEDEERDDGSLFDSSDDEAGSTHSEDESDHKPQLINNSHSETSNLRRALMYPSDRFQQVGLRRRNHGAGAPPEIASAVLNVRFIAKHLKEDSEESKSEEDWRYIAMVIDRLFLWIFAIASFAGTGGIILQAPTLYDNRAPLIETTA